eukprot:GHVU01021133.1.p1 GENE.GHVU01021133.1~~GHVU01021133.1.p1  ORF type:complete len:132 (-),score=5.86 GHVU01021133.1:672-1067(-)
MTPTVGGGRRVDGRTPKSCAPPTDHPGRQAGRQAIIHSVPPPHIPSFAPPLIPSLIRSLRYSRICVGVFIYVFIYLQPPLLRNNNNRFCLVSELSLRRDFDLAKLSSLLVGVVFFSNQQVNVNVCFISFVY